MSQGHNVTKKVKESGDPVTGDVVTGVDVVILCGGLGTRLRSVDSQNPKVMVKIDDRPFLDILVGYLKDEGFKRLILCTGYKADDVEKYFSKNSHGLTIEFSREKEPLGTGGAIKNAKSAIKSNPFVVLNGDSFCRADFQSLLKFHAVQNALATVVLSEVEDRRDFGTITLDSLGRIENYQEKQSKTSSKYVNAGIYCLNQEIFSFMPVEKIFSIERDLFPKLIGKSFFGFKGNQKFLDIGTPERYEQAKKDLKKG